MQYLWSVTLKMENMALIWMFAPAKNKSLYMQYVTIRK